MMFIQAEIEILAPPEVVWEVLIDFEAYAVWNPFLRRVAAPVLLEEEPLEVVLQPSGQRGVKIRPWFVTLRPPFELRWQGQVLHRWLVSGDHLFALRATPGGTLFWQRLRFGGILARLAMALIYSDTLRGMEEMNAALKVQVERRTLRPARPMP